MNKLIIVIFTLVIFTSCSYEPMLSNKVFNYSFKEIILGGERKTGERIKNSLVKKGGGEKKYILNIKTNKIRNIISNDRKGDPSIYELKLIVDYSVFEDENNIYQNTLIKKVTYNDKVDKFELSKYEENLLKNLSDNMANEIIIEISRLTE